MNDLEKIEKNQQKIIASLHAISEILSVVNTQCSLGWENNENGLPAKKMRELRELLEELTPKA